MDSPLYLLDTNILFDLIRNPKGAVMRRIEALGEETVCTSIVVAAEMRFGAEKKGSSTLIAKVGEILNNIDVLPFDLDADRHYAEIRNFLEKQGLMIGPNDLLIGAHARSAGLIVVTDNTREFERIPDLTVENWLLPPSANL